MVRENFVGIPYIERSSVNEGGIKLCQPTLQLVRYEPFVDPRCEI
jgi:hypothetical protein